MTRIDAIKAELDADKLSRGYAAMTDQQVADSLNSVDRNQDMPTMSADDILNAIDIGEFRDLSSADKSLVLSLLSIGDLDPKGLAASILVDTFGAPSTTISNLATRRTKLISRAAELGLGTVKPGNVAEARAI